MLEIPDIGHEMHNAYFFLMVSIGVAVAMLLLAGLGISYFPGDHDVECEQSNRECQNVNL